MTERLLWDPAVQRTFRSYNNTHSIELGIHFSDGVVLHSSAFEPRSTSVCPLHFGESA